MESLLTVTATLGVLCIVATVASLAFDVEPLVFRSGSMSPTISTGDLAVARSVPASELAKGDIVSVRTAKGERVTHRITRVEDVGDARSLTLKGDSNSTADIETYSVNSADKVLFSIPKVGYIVNAVSGTVGAFGGGLLVALVLFVAFGPGRRFTPRPSREGRRRAGTTALALVAGTGLIVGSSDFKASPTWALWTDSATALSGELKGHTVIKPNSHTCDDKGGILGLLGYVTATWPNMDLRYQYRVVAIRVSDGAQVGNAVLVPNPGVMPATVIKDFTVSLLSLGLGQANFDLRVYSTLTGSPTWQSSAYETIPVKTQSLLVGLSLRCR